MEQNTTNKVISEVSKPKEGTIVNESVVNPDNKVYRFADEGILGLPSEIQQHEKVIMENSRSVGKLFIKDEVKFRGTCWTCSERMDLTTCWHTVSKAAARIDVDQEKWQVDFNAIKNTNKMLYLFDIDDIGPKSVENDLVILKAASKLKNPVPLKTYEGELQVGQEIYIIGFPSKILKITLNLKRFSVIATISKR